jgi:hypothetical protein
VLPKLRPAVAFSTNHSTHWALSTMSKISPPKFLLSIWVLGLSPATLISLALSPEKTFRLPVFVPILQQNFAISMYNHFR